jgi:hypothetical protein
MIALDSTLKSLELVLGGVITTTEPDWTIAYTDIDATTLGVTAVFEGDGQANGSTAVTIAAAPSSGKTRQILHISVVNRDTVAATVIIQINNNGTVRQLWRGSLDPNETLEYEG